MYVQVYVCNQRHVWWEIFLLTQRRNGLSLKKKHFDTGKNGGQTFWPNDETWEQKVKRV